MRKKVVMVNFFIKIFLILSMVTGFSAQARVNELSLEIKRIKTLRHAYYPEKTDWVGFAGLNWDVSDKNDMFYWDNQVAFYGDSSQVRHIYWQYELGFKIGCFDFFYYHKSEHAADVNKNDIGHPSKFPLEDSGGVRINFLNNRSRC